MVKDLDLLCAPSSASLIEAIAAIDRSANGLCCLTDGTKFAALLTDGDVRRALLSGADLNSRALDHATVDPRTVPSGTARALVLDLMRSLRISAVPELDEDHTLVGVHTLSELTAARIRPNAAVIMAGGKGTRLGHLTDHTPKPLMKVAGRSILEWLVLGLVSDGFRNIYVSVNHMADQIVEHLGDGTRLGCRIQYLHEETHRPLGTAGSLTLLPKAVREGPDPVIVMNGDLMVEFDAGRLVEHHVESTARLTMGVRSYSHTVPFGVVELDEDLRVTAIAEKPAIQVEINTAVYCVDADLIRLLPPREASTMPDLVQACLEDDHPVSAWTMTSDWIDVGTPADLARAKGHA